MAVSNGKLKEKETLDDGQLAFTWFVSYPINNYNLSVNIGDYAYFNDLYTAKDGSQLQLNYYVLDYNLKKAKEHFKQVHDVLAAYEHYFGKYPFWEDGYALIETPYLGMEHQSGIAYGNQYMRGYLGGMIPSDMNWDYIIVHETGHEYFGNSVSCKDHAEMWIHESFTTYMEALFVEYMSNYEDAERYLVGQRSYIRNVDPIVGPLGVNFGQWVGSDHYYKGAWFLHTLRHHMNNDKQWFDLLRAFYEKYTLAFAQTDDFIKFAERFTKKKLRPIIEQYLYHADLPTLHYTVKSKGKKALLTYWWEADESKFDLSVIIKEGPLKRKIYPITGEKRTLLLPCKVEDFSLDTNKGLYKTQRH